jgi:hypothetical protein
MRTQFTGTRNFCLMIMVSLDESLHEVVSLCKRSCSERMNKCLQEDGTHHFSLFAGQKLTYEQATELSYEVKGNSTLLPNFHVTGLMPWGSGVYLSTDTKIDHIMDAIHAPFALKTPQLHLSIYRVKGYKPFSEYKKEINQVKEALSSIENFGYAKGTSIVLKEIGAKYDGSDGRFYRILYSESDQSHP